MKVKITNSIKIAVSPRQNKMFCKGEVYDVTCILANRLKALGKAKFFHSIKEDNPVVENKSINPVVENKSSKARKRKSKMIADE